MERAHIVCVVLHKVGQRAEGYGRWRTAHRLFGLSGCSIGVGRAGRLNFGSETLRKKKYSWRSRWSKMIDDGVAVFVIVGW
jgi:hypothetical protein